MATGQTKDLVSGKYGQTVKPMNEEVRKKIIGDAEVITCRPADLLEPGLVKAADELPPDTIRAEEDILSYALFPEVALGYFK